MVEARKGLNEMPGWVTEIPQQFRRLAAEVGVPFTGIDAKWVALQLAVIIVAWLAAASVSRFLTPRFEARIRQIKGDPKLLRFLALTLRRLRWILFTVILWSIAIAMREVTWPSRSYFIVVAANLATAGVIISIVSRLVRVRFVANLIAIAAWTVAALSILGILDETTALLDGVGIEFQDFRLTPLLVIKTVSAVLLFLWLAVMIGRFAERRIRSIEDLSPSLQVLFGKLVKALLIVTAVVGGLSMVGVKFTVLAVFSGAIGLGIGFGLQKVVSNLISGIILLLDKSIKPGDVISVGDTYGQINQLAARYASVISRDGREYLIPNEDLITSQVINWSYSSPLVRLDLDFGVSYEANPHEVRKLARETAAKHERVETKPPPACHITGFGDSAIEYKMRFWIRDPDNGTVNVRGDIFLMLWDALDEAGIEIPYPHRDVKLREPIQVHWPKPAPDPAG